MEDLDRTAASLPATGAAGKNVDPSPTPATEEAIRTCPNCGRSLEERRCKLFCPDPRCGYFLSCADYY
jgi:hypothetical protein